MDGRLREQKRMNELIAWMHAWMNGRMMNGRMDRLIDGLLDSFIPDIFLFYWIS